MNAIAHPAVYISTRQWLLLFLWALFYVMPFADAATGYLVLSGAFPEAAAGSISQFFRAALLLPALFLLRGSAVVIVALLILYVLMLESLMLMAHQQAGWAIVSIIYAFKIVYLIVCYYVLQQASTSAARFDIAKYFVHGATIYGVILLASTAAGLHAPTYGEDNFGSKGLFASGNGLSLYLGTASVMALIRSQSSRQLRDRAEAFFLVLCCLLVGTKASMVFGLLFVATWLYDAPLLWKSAIVVVLAVAGTWFASQIYVVFSVVFDVIVFRFNQSESLFAFLASGRDAYVADAFASFDPSGWSVLRLIFGAGAYLSFRTIGEAPAEYDTLESDLFDIFFAYGLLGLTAYLAMIVYGLVIGLRNRQFGLVLVWGATCFYSAAAGHVVFNAMSGLALPVLLIAMHQFPKLEHG